MVNRKTETTRSNLGRYSQQALQTDSSSELARPVLSKENGIQFALACCWGKLHKYKSEHFIRNSLFLPDNAAIFRKPIAFGDIPAIVCWHCAGKLYVINGLLQLALHVPAVLGEGQQQHPHAVTSAHKPINNELQNGKLKATKGS
ncbi:unnamed protein product [Ceratitis capitata]|uniref:(Mediterranean fruit fly) hypothetical protein n=1 Tax=Ceratitis capitata TaxID=7213 RepID=A0A811UNI8_CERCA|nr:unnamed protein product [Ceratitis capitata]